MIAPNLERATEFCGAVAAECHCYLNKEHESSHVCECGGSWDGHFGEDDFVIVKLPDPLWKTRDRR